MDIWERFGRPISEDTVQRRTKSKIKIIDLVYLTILQKISFILKLFLLNFSLDKLRAVSSILDLSFLCYMFDAILAIFIHLKSLRVEVSLQLYGFTKIVVNFLLVLDAVISRLNKSAVRHGISLLTRDCLNV